MERKIEDLIETDFTSRGSVGGSVLLWLFGIALFLMAFGATVVLLN